MAHFNVFSKYAEMCAVRGRVGMWSLTAIVMKGFLPVSRSEESSQVSGSLHLCLIRESRADFRRVPIKCPLVVSRNPENDLFAK